MGEVQELPEGLDVDEGGQIVSNELFSVVAHVDDSIENGLDHTDEMRSAEENNAADNLCQSTLEETMEVLSGSDFIVKVDSESLRTMDIPEDPVQSGVTEIGDDTNELGHNKISIDLNEDAHNNIEESTDSSQDQETHTCNIEQAGDSEESINNVKILDYNDESLILKDEPSHYESIERNNMCVENDGEPADYNGERACNENSVDQINDLLTKDVTTDHGDDSLDMEESLSHNEESHNSVNNENSVDHIDESVDIDDHTEKPLSCDENNPNNVFTEKNDRDNEENMK